jgi:formamidopyrimidine-DNA glycosylase
MGRAGSSYIYTLVRALVGLETGLNCRRCSDAIETSDLFGRSEGVCHVCRD